MQPSVILRKLFDTAVRAASAEIVIPQHLPARPSGRVIVIGAGKAAASMAQAVENHWDGPLEGMVVTRYGHAVPTRSIKVVEASHPVPDAIGERAALDMLAMVQNLSPDDLVLCLISGGGSALLSLPAKDVSFEEKRNINHTLLRSGATIHEMNCVRKHLSAIKGGRLAAAAAPAKVVTLAISDVPGDDPATIASGPTVPDPTSCSDAIAVLDRYAIPISARIRKALQNGILETPKPLNPIFSRCETKIIVTPQQALEAAAQDALVMGYEPLLLGDAIEGEARDIAKIQAALAQAAKPKTVLISGGETTVTLRGGGRGGRNAEYLLALAIALGENANIHALAADTDGIDGSEDNAGAIIGPRTLSLAATKGIDARAMLDNNDAYGFFQAINGLIMTGPTRTNVNDFRAILID